MRERRHLRWRNRCSCSCSSSGGSSDGGSSRNDSGGGGSSSGGSSTTAAHRRIEAVEGGQNGEQLDAPRDAKLLGGGTCRPQRPVADRHDPHARDVLQVGDVAQLGVGARPDHAHPAARALLVRKCEAGGGLQAAAAAWLETRRSRCPSFASRFWRPVAFREGVSASLRSPQRRVVGLGVLPCRPHRRSYSSSSK